MKKLNLKYEEPEFEAVIKESLDDEFEIGQIYENEPVKKLCCVKCGSDNFFVGQGSYFTAVKCPNCKWEKCIHNG